MSPPPCSAALAHAKLGDLTAARPLLNASLHCTFVATGAFMNLQRLWQHLLAQPGGKQAHAVAGEGNTLPQSASPPARDL
jgi:hypothetical protein